MNNPDKVLTEMLKAKYDSFPPGGKNMSKTEFVESCKRALGANKEKKGSKIIIHGRN